MSVSSLKQKSLVLIIAGLAIALAPQAQAAKAPMAHSTQSEADESTDDEAMSSDAREMDQDDAETRSAATQSPADEDTEMTSTSAMDEAATTDTVEVRSDRTPVREVAPAATAPAMNAQSETGSTAQRSNIVEANPSVGGELRAPSPKALDSNRRGYFQLGVGPAYGAAFISDSLMYNVVGSYNFNSSEKFTIKALADLYMATGSVSSRLYNFGVGAEYYLSELETETISPYAAADAGIGFGRNADDQTGTALTLGAGVGFKFQVNELNWDLNAHYAQLTANVGPSAPAIFALRGAVAF